MDLPLEFWLQFVISYMTREKYRHQFVCEPRDEHGWKEME